MYLLPFAPRLPEWPPAESVTGLAARRGLEGSKESGVQVASKCWYGSLDSMRRAFEEHWELHGIHIESLFAQPPSCTIKLIAYNLAINETK